LPIVVKPTFRSQHLGQDPFSRVAKGCVAKVVGERNRLGQILVEAQRTRDGTGNLRAFEGVGQTIPIVVTLVMDEHLSLVLQPPKRSRVDNPIAIALIGSSELVFGLGVEPAPGVRAPARDLCQAPNLIFLLGGPIAEASRANSS